MSLLWVPANLQGTLQGSTCPVTDYRACKPCKPCPGLPSVSLSLSLSLSTCTPFSFLSAPLHPLPFLPPLLHFSPYPLLYSFLTHTPCCTPSPSLHQTLSLLMPPFFSLPSLQLPYFQLPFSLFPTLTPPSDLPSFPQPPSPSLFQPKENKLHSLSFKLSNHNFYIH